MTVQTKQHYQQIIERAKRFNWSNRDTIIAECRWHIEQIEKRTAEFNENWARLKQLKRSRTENHGRNA